MKPTARRPLAFLALPALVAALAVGGVAPGVAAAKEKLDGVKTEKVDHKAGQASGRKVR